MSLCKSNILIQYQSHFTCIYGLSCRNGYHTSSLSTFGIDGAPPMVVPSLMFSSTLPSLTFKLTRNNYVFLHWQVLLVVLVLNLEGYLWWKNLNHKQDLMKDIKTYNKNWELKKADFDWSHRKPFLCSSDVQGCVQFVKERNPGFNWLFPFNTQKNVLWRVRSCSLFSIPKRKHNRIG